MCNGDRRRILQRQDVLFRIAAGDDAKILSKPTADCLLDIIRLLSRHTKFVNEIQPTGDGNSI